MFEKIFDLIKNNFKNPKLYVFLLVVLLTVLVLFPYIDANFFYYNRVNDRIDILTKVSEINVEQIQENEILYKEYNSIANIYLKNISSKRDGFFNVYANRDKVIDFVKSKYKVFEHISYSMRSIIFMQKFVLPGSNSGTFIFELFYDWSCKITVPIGLSNGSRKDDYLNIYTELGYDKESVENFQLASGSDIFNALFFGMCLFENIANQYKLKEKDYAFCLEIENAGDTVVAFDGDKYKEYIEKYGIPYAHKEINKGKISFLRDFPKVSFNDLSYSLIADDLGAAFGFRSDSVFEILQDSNKKYT